MAWGMGADGEGGRSHEAGTRRRASALAPTGRLGEWEARGSRRSPMVVGPGTGVRWERTQASTRRVELR